MWGKTKGKRRDRKMKDERDVKSCNMKIRISPKEKEALEKYAAKHSITMSEAIR